MIDGRQINRRKAYKHIYCKFYLTRELSWGNEDPKKQLELTACILNWTERSKSWKCHKVNALARAVHGGKRRRKIRVSLTRFVCADFSWLQLPVLGENNVVFLLVYGRPCPWGRWGAVGACPGVAAKWVFPSLQPLPAWRKRAGVLHAEDRKPLALRVRRYAWNV